VSGIQVLLGILKDFSSVCCVVSLGSVTLPRSARHDFYKLRLPSQSLRRNAFDPNHWLIHQ
jgi:hypothetical protein